MGSREVEVVVGDAVEIDKRRPLEVIRGWPEVGGRGSSGWIVMHRVLQGEQNVGGPGARGALRVEERLGLELAVGEADEPCGMGHSRGRSGRHEAVRDRARRFVLHGRGGVAIVVRVNLAGRAFA